MIEFEEFKQIVKPLRVLRFPLQTEEDLLIYYDKLKNLNKKIFMIAIDFILQNNKEFPTISEILNAYYSVSKAKFRKCARCNDLFELDHECFIAEELLLLWKYDREKFNLRMANEKDKAIWQKFYDDKQIILKDAINSIFRLSNEEILSILSYIKDNLLKVKDEEKAKKIFEVIQHIELAIILKEEI
jgi:hypothetical protein